VLFKIPQNVIISLIISLIGATLLWMLIDDYQLSLSGTYCLINSSTQLNSGVSKVAVLLILFFASVVVFQINKGHRLVEGNQNPFVLFTMLGFVSTFFVNGSLLDVLAVLLSVFSLSLVLRVYNQKSVLGLLFAASLILGIASVLFYPILLAVIIPLLTVLFFRPFELRNYIVIALGFALPFFYFSCVVYLFNLPWKLENIELASPNKTLYSLEYIGSSLAFLILSLIAAVKVFFNRSKFVARQRNQLLIVSIFISVQLGILIVLQNCAPIVGVIPFLALFILYYYKKHTRMWVMDAIALLLLCTLVWINF
jgi:hypothetical protein